MKVIDYINSHPNWQDELSGEPYFISIKQDGEYFMLKYNQIKSDFNEELVRECRGLVVKQFSGYWMPKCHAMNKFGNFGESYCPDINWSTASVQEKIDGSLIKFWWDEIWHISTNGTLDAFNAETGDALHKTYGALVLDVLKAQFGDEHEFLGMLDKNCTYWFELVSPYTKIVIPYEQTALYFLGWRDKADDKELDPMDCVLRNYFPMPKRYSLSSLKEVQDAAAALPWDEEGFVVCDNHFNRVKIKSLAYVKAHYARNNDVITDEHLIGVILDGEEEEFLTYCPEYAQHLKALDRMMHNEWVEATKLERSVWDAWKADKYDHDKKGFAQCVKEHCEPKYAPYVFKCYDAWVRDENYGWANFIDGWSAAKWKKFLGL